MGRPGSARPPWGDQPVARDATGGRQIVRPRSLRLLIHCPQKSDLHSLLEDLEYSKDMYDSLRLDEMQISPFSCSYKGLQNCHEETVDAARANVVKWILDTNFVGRSCIHPETVSLAVSTIDRFLSLQSIDLRKLRLVGAAALLLASKYEQGCNWDTRHYLFNTSGYSQKNIVEAEMVLWHILEGKLKVPTAYHFAVLVLKTCSTSCSEEDLRQLEKTTLSLLKITLLSYKFVGLPPSIVACTRIFAARLRTRLVAWDSSLYTFTGYNETDFRFCLDKLHPLIGSGPPSLAPQQHMRVPPSSSVTLHPAPARRLAIQIQGDGNLTLRRSQLSHTVPGPYASSANNQQPNENLTPQQLPVIPSSAKPSVVYHHGRLPSDVRSARPAAPQLEEDPKLLFQRPQRSLTDPHSFVPSVSQRSDDKNVTPDQLLIVPSSEGPLAQIIDDARPCKRVQLDESPSLLFRRPQQSLTYPHPFVPSVSEWIIRTFEHTSCPLFLLQQGQLLTQLTMPGHAKGISLMRDSRDSTCKKGDQLWSFC